MPKVYLSPSKQENNIGVGNYGTEEKIMNDVADVVAKCLTASNIDWERNNPSMSSLEIVKDSNKKKVDLHLAMHTNADSKGLARGAEVLVFALGGEKERFAKILYKNISALTPTEDRGIKVNPNLIELNKTDAPAALVEYIFHTNKDDARFMLENINDFGITTAKSVCEYFNVPFINPYEKKEEPKTDTIYRVQVGAFSNRDNANKVRERLKLLGYNAIVVASK